MNKKFCAVFTIVNNEKFFLPIWLKHYKNFVENNDIYILDHSTTDGSTDGLDVNVIKLENSVLFNHFWLKNIVEEFQQKLLNDYEIVIFSEIDELIYTLNEPFSNLLHNFSQNNEQSYLTCSSFNIVQNLDIELPIEKDSFFLNDRNYWYKKSSTEVKPLYDKTLITKVPLQYGIGFHDAVLDKGLNYVNNLFLVHLHRIDLYEKVKKQFFRNQNYNFDGDVKSGYQNRFKTFDEIYNWFRNTPSLEKIPLEHINALKALHV